MVDRTRCLPQMFLALAIVHAPLHAAHGSSAQVGGRILDAQGRAVQGAQVTLLNAISGYRQSALTDSQGTFTFYNVPFNDYHLEATARGQETSHREIRVREVRPPALEVRMSTLGATVVVEERLGLVEEHPSMHLDIDRTTIDLSPAPVQSRAMESILLATPGFTQNENGRFHFRGSHGQLMYVVDGVPMTDQMNTTFSNSLDPAQVESMEILTGGISAEFGGKPVAVVNMTTRSGLGTPGGFEGEASLGLARFATREVGFSVRGGQSTSGWFATGALSESDRFLDVVSFDNYNNHGQTGRLFTRFDWTPTDRDMIRVSLSGGDTHRRVMNLGSQQALGQDQRVSTRDVNANAGWTHLLGSDQTFEASLYFRSAKATLDPTRDLSPGFGDDGPDAPFWARQSRTLDNLGLQAAFTQRLGSAVTLKAGLQHLSLPLEETFRFAVTRDGLYGPDSPLHPYTPAGGGAIWSFHDRLTPRLDSAYLQSESRIAGWFIAAGLRYDRYQVKDLVQAQFQPRLGVSWTLPATGTVLRASYDRLLVMRENENLALSLSQAAWDLGPYAGTPVPALRPEIQDSLSAGVEQQIGRSIRLMVEVWQKRSRNAADSGQFLNTGITFPIGMSHGDFHGWNLRADLAPTAGWSAYLSLGATRARVQAPVVGGLQLDPPEAAPGQWYLIDHDQKLSGQAGIRFEREGFHALASCRYDSGLVCGDPADEAGNPDFAFGLPYIHQDGEGTWRAKPRTVWNFGLGKAFKLRGGRSLTLGADLLNAFDKKALYTYLSGCGGTHVIPPRTWALHLKVGF